MWMVVATLERLCKTLHAIKEVARTESYLNFRRLQNLPTGVANLNNMTEILKLEKKLCYTKQDIV